jgi:hypothetical protein
MKKLLLVLLSLLIVHARFVRHESGNIVMDLQTGLMWQDQSANKTVTRAWAVTTGNETAINYCENLSISFTINSELVTFNDWRLPNYNELISIVDRDDPDHAIYYDNSTNSNKFQHYVTDHYWTSTTYKSPTTKAWTVNFYYGEDSIKDKAELLNIRCVRTTGDNDGDGVKD